LEKVREESVLMICIDESGQELFLLRLERDVEGGMMVNWRISSTQKGKGRTGADINKENSYIGMYN
jgi:hypothetical protein